MNKTLGIIHPTLSTTKVIQPYIDEILPEIQVMNICDDTIQRENMKAKIGTIPKFNYFKFTTYAKFLEQAGADLIMVACTLFNQSIEVARPMISTPLMQIDRHMMDIAVQTGKKIGMLTTVPQTVHNSERLLKMAAADAKKDITIKTIVCPQAFGELKKGNKKRHDVILLDNINKLMKEVDCICMAQVSLAILEKELVNIQVPVYNSVRTGLMKAKEILKSL